jgi:hypothetical protein
MLKNSSWTQHFPWIKPAWGRSSSPEIQQHLAADFHFIVFCMSAYPTGYKHGKVCQTISFWPSSSFCERLFFERSHANGDMTCYKFTRRSFETSPLLETRSDRTFVEESENCALLLCFLRCSMPPKRHPTLCNNQTVEEARTPCPTTVGHSLRKRCVCSVANRFWARGPQQSNHCTDN